MHERACTSAFHVVETDNQCLVVLCLSLWTHFGSNYKLKGRLLVRLCLPCYSVYIVIIYEYMNMYVFISRRLVGPVLGRFLALVVRLPLTLARMPLGTLRTQFLTLGCQ